MSTASTEAGPGPAATAAIHDGAYPARGLSGARLALAIGLAVGWGTLFGYLAFTWHDDAAAKRAAPEVAEVPRPRPPVALAFATPPLDDSAPVPSPRDPGRINFGTVYDGVPPRPAQEPAPPRPGAATDQAAAPEAAAAPAPPPPFVGTWGPTRLACRGRQQRGGLIPARITTQGAKAGDTTCVFGERHQSGPAWVMTASCQDPARRWTSQVRLLVDEDRLTWSSARGVATYVRCRRT